MLSNVHPAVDSGAEKMGPQKDPRGGREHATYVARQREVEGQDEEISVITKFKFLNPSPKKNNCRVFYLFFSPRQWDTGRIVSFRTPICVSG